MKSIRGVGLVILLLVAVVVAAATRGGSTNDTSLQGTWTLIKGEADGKALTEKDLKNGKLVIKGDHYTVTLPGRDTLTGTQKIDTTKETKTIDIVDDNGANKGKACLGIFTVKGDEFEVVFAAAGKSRPTKFTTAPESGEWKHVWKRVKE
jgi:uncharacterized protein (TIGR03067 family)